MIILLPTLPLGKKYSPQESNPVLQPVYLYLSRQVLYLSRSEILVGFTDPNKQLLSVKSVLKFLNWEPGV